MSGLPSAIRPGVATRLPKMASSASTVSTAPRCFMHIPKCASTSVHVALEQALAPGTISPKRLDTALECCGFDADTLDEEVRALFAIGDDEITALSRYPIISGQFSLSTLLRVTSASAVATVLREPRTRVLSAYAFWRLWWPGVRGSWGSYQAPDHALRPLDEFLAEPLIARATDNLACRMLLGTDPRIPPAGFIAASDVSAVAGDAIGVLETLGYVGVLELGDSMWGGLSDFFAVPLSPTRVNTTASLTGRADAPAAQRLVTHHTLGLLDARTAADAIVYRHVLVANGCSAECAERLQATAFATELVRIGNVTGTSATESRARGRRIEGLTRQLRSKDDELGFPNKRLQRVTTLLHETRQELARVEDQLRWHRFWLDDIQRSASWRMTTPLRTTKRAVMRLMPTSRRVTG